MKESPMNDNSNTELSYTQSEKPTTYTEVCKMHVHFALYIYS